MQLSPLLPSAHRFRLSPNSTLWPLSACPPKPCLPPSKQPSPLQPRLCSQPASLEHARAQVSFGRTYQCRSSSSGASSSNSSPVLNVMMNTRPVDRLRYQAKFAFKLFDKDRAGRLQGEEVQGYLAYCDARFGPRSSALESLYTESGLLGSDASLGFEQFVDLVRGQFRILSSDNGLLNTSMQGPDMGRLLYNCCITTREMTQALAAFKLMDVDNDGYIPVQDLASTESIERKMVEDVVDDAEEEPDKRVNFNAYVQSYARERPVALTMVIMATHTLAFWLLFSAPIDTLWKVLFSVFLLLKPQFINSPLIRAYQIIRTLFGRSQAELDMRMKPS